MGDLVKRLRSITSNAASSRPMEAMMSCQDAADRIEALEAQLAELRTEDGELLNIAYLSGAHDWRAKARALEGENARLRDCLISIEEYWNGASESAVDAAEEMRDRARTVLKGQSDE